LDDDRVEQIPFLERMMTLPPTVASPIQDLHYFNILKDHLYSNTATAKHIKAKSSNIIISAANHCQQ
jgi:hypothetical protein